MITRGRILVLVAAVSITLLIGVTVAVAGCGRRAKTTGPNTSVPNLLAGLANLRAFEVEACTYTAQSSYPGGFSCVPAPSDRLLELYGSATLSESGYQTLKSSFAWTRVSHDVIPAKLQRVGPKVNILASAKFNESFSANPTFTHGYAIVTEDGGDRRIYFVAIDRDHEIERN